jgi:hypothetical protein
MYVQISKEQENTPLTPMTRFYMRYQEIFFLGVG